MAKTGLDVKMRGGNDTFGRGSTGNPAETERDDDESQQLSYGGGHFETEAAGVESGLSDRETLDVDESEPTYNYEVDSMTGNATERKVGRENETVKGKGKSFELGEM